MLNTVLLTTVRLGPLKFSLRATIDHRGPSIHSGHYTAAINCSKKHSIATITQLWSLKLVHMFYYMNWLTHNFWTRTGGWVWSLPWRWHTLSIPLTTGWGTSAETCMMCFFLMTLVPVQKLCVNVYIYIHIHIYIYRYMHFLYDFCYRTYKYIQRKCHSILAKLPPHHVL